MNDIEDKTIDDVVQTLKKESPIRYIVAGEELAPSTGKRHWHIYVHFVNRVYFRRIRQGLLTAHIDECRGTEYDNYKYVTKERKIYEDGQCTGKTCSHKEKVERIKEMMEDIKTLSDEELESKYPYEFFYHFSKISEYKIRTHKMEVPWQGQLHYKNIWIYGPPGTGKSRWSNNLTSPWNIYHKNINKWWDGYQFDSHHLVLIEDWPVDKQMLGQQLKIWGDRYQFIGEC